MKHLNRASQIFVSLILTIAVTCSLAAAAGIAPRASEYLSSYSASMQTGNSSGAVSISFTAKATQTSDYVGVSSITIYKSNGTYVTTITGTTGNGLLDQDCRTHAGSYTYYGQSGTSYYAVVTAYAARGSGSGTGTITTNTAKAG